MDLKLCELTGYLLPTGNGLHTKGKSHHGHTASYRGCTEPGLTKPRRVGMAQVWPSRPSLAPELCIPAAPGCS